MKPRAWEQRRVAVRSRHEPLAGNTGHVVSGPLTAKPAERPPLGSAPRSRYDPRVSVTWPALRPQKRELLLEHARDLWMLHFIQSACTAEIGGTISNTMKRIGRLLGIAGVIMMISPATIGQVSLTPDSGPF
jgi:hypothetical protein